MKKVALFGLLVVLLVMTISGVALAATPQDIYDDYAADSKLDGTYTEAEYRAYLADATVHGYGAPAVLDSLDKEVTKLLGSRDDFPFTGFEVLFACIAVVAIIGGGLVLRTQSSK
ncbi:MAG: hypothetical protein JW990_10555 [Thermoleophilia bacterium]|nr:hypothetical protein [Thermoleophilia bacterium]